VERIVDVYLIRRDALERREDLGEEALESGNVEDPESMRVYRFGQYTTAEVKRSDLNQVVEF